MEIVTGTMSTLLPKLGDLLKEEYNLHKGVKGEIMFLVAELERMHAALVRVSEAPIDEPPKRLVKLWARDVRELSYDIKDIIDKFMVRVDAHAPDDLHGLRGFLDRSLNLLTKAKIRHKIGTEVRDIKSRIKDVSERRKRYKVDNAAAKSTGATVDSLRQTALYKKATELVGTEEKRDGLVKRLMEGDEACKQQLKIVSIVGFGGLGKTTLANVVYEKLKVQFDCWAFVSVSLNPNMEKIFKNMLHQLDKDKYSNINEAAWGEEQLVRELREFFENKRYLIVTDDIWDDSTWERIKRALIENERGSRIITTTRILDVAKQAGGVYQLEPLSPANSKKLFYKRIFGDEHKCPPGQLAEVSENILKKCGGVPLAIITIASMLAGKEGRENTPTYWSKLYRSMGSGLEDSLHVQDMRRILSISYYDLPPHLKTCLSYLSLYPEDYEIGKHDLIWKWVGEGFVHEEQGKRFYEVGQHFLDELINKSMIQPVYIENGEVMCCRVHDMVLDLISSLSNEEHFLTALGGQQAMSVPSRIRRLCLQTSTEEDVKKLATMSLNHVRSLTVFKQAFNLLPALSSFPVLRALDLGGCRQVDNHHCKLICNLFQLRYLSLRGTSITEIPKEIGNLQFLKVLDISYTGIKWLPSTFLELRQVVYLYVDYLMRLPSGFGDLICLEELPHIPIWSPNMFHDLSRLTKLRCLYLSFNQWDESYREPFLQCLHDLVSLETLRIQGCRGLVSLCDKLTLGSQLLRSIDIAGEFLYAVPGWMAELSSLSSLRICLETLGMEDLQVLGAIPSLSNLFLWVKQPTQGRHERLAIHSADQFRCLSSLELDFDGNAMEVVFGQGAMQKLQTLWLYFRVRETMDQFGDFNLGLENLSSLERVIVHMCRYDATSGEAAEADAAEAAIQKALDMNPNNPTLKLVNLLS